MIIVLEHIKHFIFLVIWSHGSWSALFTRQCFSNKVNKAFVERIYWSKSKEAWVEL